MDWPVVIGVKLGRLRWGWVERGVATVADSSTEVFGPLCCSLRGVDMVRLGSAVRGEAWHGAARHGEAIVADGSKEGASLPCCSRKGVDWAALGESWCASARLGFFRQQLQTAARRAYALPAALSKEWLRSDLARHDLDRHGGGLVGL